MIGAMTPGGMITKKIRLDEVAEQGFKALVEDKDNRKPLPCSMESITDHPRETEVKILVDVGAGL
jgi:hypothetical protein